MLKNEAFQRSRRSAVNYLLCRLLGDSRPQLNRSALADVDQKYDVQLCSRSRRSAMQLVDLRARTLKLRILDATPSSPLV